MLFRSHVLGRLKAGATKFAQGAARLAPLTEAIILAELVRYIDEIIREDDPLKFRSRLCGYDSEMILNSLIYPV